MPKGIIATWKEEKSCVILKGKMETGNNEELKGWPIKLTLLAEKRNKQKSVQLQRNQA